MGRKTNKKGSEKHEKIGNGFVDPMSVTWAEKYDGKISWFWNKLPESVAKILATLAVFVVGISVNGTWINIITHAGRQMGYMNFTSHEATNIYNSILQGFRLKHFMNFFVGSCIISYGLYFGIGGFLHWYYYVRRRHQAEEWKCQPKKWLPPDLERHEILIGSLTLLVNATISAITSCYMSNGGYSTVYYKISDYGWLWFFLQFVLIFIYQDYATYWLHRIYHYPWLYKHFHKLHHKYKQPTAFSVTAIHPIEALHIQLTLMIPLFTIPVHWFPFYVIALYAYYHGIIDHSGINFKRLWWQPWQPDAIFHDNHHQYFHVNFGFNIEYWDKLHGTYRLKDRVYREDTFYGGGRDINELNSEELKEELEERNSENPLAYKDNVMAYKLGRRDVKSLKSKEKHFK